jgi:rfaE bifunctional protein kinase chain/domain
MTNKSPNILVVGDVILDEYIWSTVSRISPEAPVPVCHVSEHTYQLGGAGNVAHNLRSLGCQVSLLGAMGTDINATHLFGVLKNAGIHLTWMIQKDHWVTITKARVMAKHHQLCRIDHEQKITDFLDFFQDIKGQLLADFHQYDAVILSDYNKGVLGQTVTSSIIEFAQTHAIPVMVDPKGKDAKKYAGATMITPNMSEFIAMSSQDIFLTDADIQSFATHLIKTHGFQTVILTRSEKGISVITPETMVNYPTKAKAVLDVTGAGDTVIAALGYGLANGWPIDHMIHVANGAASVVIAKVGTSTATLTEIQPHVPHLQLT